METIKKYYRVERSQIAYLRFIFEAYDGLANITTLDAALGMIVLRIAPGRESTAKAVISDLQKTILIEPETMNVHQVQPGVVS